MIPSDKYVTVVFEDLSKQDLDSLLQTGYKWSIVSCSNAIDDRDQLLLVLGKAEAALADIGDAEREPGDDLEWCENRAAEALPLVRETLRSHGRSF